jgi:hypothetical protein
LLNRMDIEVRRVARSLLSSAAEEVEVLTAVAHGPLHDKPVVTPGTPQHALEVVVVGPCPSSQARMGVEHLLHPPEQLGTNKRLVPARALDALVFNEAEVVPIAQQRQISSSDWSPTPRTRRTPVPKPGA